MSTPTLDEMKLAVVKMLPETIFIGSDHQAYWRSERQAVGGQFQHQRITAREWLHVCWLAEQKLTNGKYREFTTYLEMLTGCTADILVKRGTVSAELERRIQALCRVRHPEMFTLPKP